MVGRSELGRQRFGRRPRFISDDATVRTVRHPVRKSQHSATHDAQARTVRHPVENRAPAAVFQVRPIDERRGKTDRQRRSLLLTRHAHRRRRRERITGLADSSHPLWGAGRDQYRGLLRPRLCLRSHPAFSISGRPPDGGGRTSDAPTVGDGLVGLAAHDRSHQLAQP
jgi:hypothetical protein